MVQYASREELGAYLQQEIDNSTADIVLQLSSGAFSEAANTWFAAQTATYVTLGTPATAIRLPYRPVTAVSAVRINGLVVTGYTLIRNVLYRQMGFGTSWTVPPDKVEIDLTHGYTSVPDDVKAAVLETAASAYQQAVGNVQSEKIDDYWVTYAEGGGGLHLTSDARTLAMSYCGTWVA